MSCIVQDTSFSFFGWQWMSLGVQPCEFDQSGDRGRDSSSQLVVVKAPILFTIDKMC